MYNIKWLSIAEWNLFSRKEIGYMLDFVKKLFGMGNEALLKPLYKTVAKINSLEGDFVSLSDEELSAKTDEFRARYKQGETLDQLLP